jgi:predicted acetyltransferase
MNTGPPSNFLIRKIGPESDRLLRNLLQHYIHDMSEWFEIDTGPDGSYSYDTSLIWENGYGAYLATVGDSNAGFALIGSAAEWIGETGGHEVHEFFVLRRFRRSGIGQKMAALLWDQLPGEWLVRVLESNVPALLFWRTIIAVYTRGTYEEEERTVGGRSWRFFRFMCDDKRLNSMRSESRIV